ncbi:chorismate binding domain-containing protein [Nitritalea halalkaliphila LW7]|uniref:Chorismate binding domain-containing protein n=1 Tax=Nitritalea halalkaliphila LW7 TaxID=1189621 RepID=I5BTA0_9BACT|nr:chorismate-binding protein [Nitritalea halalkaliphila]EIM72802.1 chorismate binding domain-containing protein [Nitritalea halalkaliphila LW7]
MQSTLYAQETALEQVLDGLIQNALLHGKAFALWRQPKTSTLHFLADDSGELKRVQADLEQLPAGFIAHPFADQADEKAYFIAADVHETFSLEQATCAWPEHQGAPAEPPKQLLPWSQLAPLLAPVRMQEREKGGYRSPKQREEHQYSHFIQTVQEAIAAIQRGELRKVVPARTKHVPLQEHFSPARALLALANAYPNAFVNFFHLPQVGTWMGASPETLVRTRGAQFYTMSLAGTQVASVKDPLKHAAWTQKEIEEQALVSRYIVDCFKKIRLREYEEIGPKTVVAGHLLHLRSDFFVDMEATNFPQLGSVMLRLLHPTSAVCGMPREAAHRFLRQHEQLDRSLFAGYMGPVQVQGMCSIYVNLRTARLTPEGALLFAGAGVTEDSDPEKEWRETELKCATIARHLHPDPQD